MKEGWTHGGERPVHVKNKTGNQALDQAIREAWLFCIRRRFYSAWGFGLYDGCRGRPRERFERSSPNAITHAVWVTIAFLIGIGLIGYVIWMVLSAIKDTEGHGNSRRGLSRRIGNFFSAAVYTSIAWNALRFVFGQGDGGTSEQTWSAYVLAQPFGQWLTGLTGAGFIVFAIVQFMKGVRAAFMKEFDTSKMNKQMICITKNTGRAGNIARAIIFSAIGYFLIKTAMTADPDDTRGFDGALAELAQQPHGKLILSILALGLILYGMYAIMKGIYQHMTWEK